MPKGLCRIDRIVVTKDGDDWGSADMNFWLEVNGTGFSIGRFPGVEDVKTLPIGRSFEFDLSNIIRLRFEARDEEPSVWGMSDQVAVKFYEIDTSGSPLPRFGARMTADEHSVKATIYFDLLPLSKIETGEMFALACLGHVPGLKWLDGNTVAGTVNLAPQTGGSYSGTRWRAHPLRDDLFTLECLGSVPGPRWLDGNTVSGDVTLVAETGGRFTGTVWRLHLLGDDQVRLECMGNVPGPRWLDGNTINGVVGLVPETDGYSGTMWKLA